MVGVEYNGLILCIIHFLWAKNELVEAREMKWFYQISEVLGAPPYPTWGGCSNQTSLSLWELSTGSLLKQDHAFPYYIVWSLYY